jgi:hypothetical protein
MEEAAKTALVYHRCVCRGNRGDGETPAIACVGKQKGPPVLGLAAHWTVRSGKQRRPYPLNYRTEASEA